MSASRVGRMPVTIPAGVVVTVGGEEITVKGPKGQLTFPLHTSIAIGIEDNQIKVRPNSEARYCRPGSGAKLNKSITGTTRAKLSNMVTGVTKGFEKTLQIVGVGYKAQAKGKILNLNLGYSHIIDFPVPEGITIETPSPIEILIKGIDYDLVGHTAARIRKYRKPEPYKGKGIKYKDEVIVRKETKKK